MSNPLLNGVLGRCTLTTSAIRNYAAMAPRVRQAKRLENRVMPSRAPSERPSWPIALLDAAHRAGGLSIPTNRAVSVLDNAWDLRQRKALSGSAVLKILEENETSPTTLTLIAKVLMRGGGGGGGEPLLVKYAGDLLHMSSEIGEQAATMILVDEGLRQNKLGHQQLQNALRQLNHLVKRDVIEAIILAARVAEGKGNPADALELYKRATVLSADLNSPADTLKPSLSEAWFRISRIEHVLGNPESANEAMRTAALKYDSPEAFYELALQSDVGSPEERLDHLLKAATSGLGNAAYKLGLWHSAQADEGQRSVAASLESRKSSVLEMQRHSSLPKKYTLSHEWFSVAAESDTCAWKTQASLHIARILRKARLIAKSTSSLESALAHVKTQPKLVTWLRENWPSASFNPTTEEFEDLVQQK